MLLTRQDRTLPETRLAFRHVEENCPNSPFLREPDPCNFGDNVSVQARRIGPDGYLPAGDLEGGSEDLRADEFCHGDGVDESGGSGVFWLKRRRSRKRIDVMERGAWGTAERTNNDVGVFVWLEIKDILLVNVRLAVCCGSQRHDL